MMLQHFSLCRLYIIHIFLAMLNISNGDFLLYFGLEGNKVTERQQTKGNGGKVESDLMKLLKDLINFTFPNSNSYFLGIIGDFHSHSMSHDEDEDEISQFLYTFSYLSSLRSKIILNL